MEGWWGEQRLHSATASPSRNLFHKNGSPTISLDHACQLNFLQDFWYFTRHCGALWREEERVGEGRAEDICRVFTWLVSEHQILIGDHTESCTSFPGKLSIRCGCERWNMTFFRTWGEWKNDCNALCNVTQTDSWFLLLYQAVKQSNLTSSFSESLVGQI